jgi:hypothetical protein
MSGRTYHNAKAVIEAAEKDPALRDIVERMDRTGNVSAAYREVKRRESQKRLSTIAAPEIEQAKPEIVKDPETAAGDSNTTASKSGPKTINDTPTRSRKPKPLREKVVAWLTRGIAAFGAENRNEVVRIILRELK